MVDTHFEPIIKEIINTKKGNVKVTFWKDMIQQQQQQCPDNYYDEPNNVDG